MTASGVGYGRGNLGPNGIKAFFMRHKCNQICELLGLSDKGTSGFQRVGTPGSPLLNHTASSVPLSMVRAGSPSPPRKPHPSAEFDSDSSLLKELSINSDSSRSGVPPIAVSAASSVDDDIFGLFAASPPVGSVKPLSSITSSATSSAPGNKNVPITPPARKNAGVHCAAGPSISEADENLMDSILNGL
jgi:hypothetical protein